MRAAPRRWPTGAPVAAPLCPDVEAGLGAVVRAAQRTAAAPPLTGADPAPRWTLRRLVGWVAETFGCLCCRETIRRALHRLELSWKKARKLLGRDDPQRREAFLAQVQDLLAGAQQDRHRLVYLDEAHIQQEADLGYGWSARGQRFWVASHSPRLADRLSFYGLYLYNEGEVRLWPYARANGENTIAVLHRLRAEWPDQPLILLWDGAPYHRAKAVREAAATLQIELVPLPGYSSTASKPASPRPACSHWDKGPASRPTRATSSPSPRNQAAKASGSLATLASRTICPVASTTHTLLSFSEKSIPAKCSMAVPR